MAIRPPSTSQLSPAASRQSIRPSQIITVPPWARDEPPSPTEPIHGLPITLNDATMPRQSVASSYSSQQGTPWWSFTSTQPRQRPFLQEKPDKPRMSFKDRSMSWLPNTTREAGSFLRRDKAIAAQTPTHMHPIDGLNKEMTANRPDAPHLALPMPANAPYTLSQNRTPGWESPWSAGVQHNGAHFFGSEEDNPGPDAEDDENKHLSTWRRRRKRFRQFVLSNIYVPLLFRFINITFTAATLGIAIRIRLLEKNASVLGALGSSPMLAIIFAPPTLVHVLGAIYLEYFGRPLGLWRTSRKLAHTLSEVLFICAWSAVLSLCFDNYFTSLIPCVGPSDISWYSSLPRPQSPIPDTGRHEGGVGDTLCDYQLALIGLVLVGLLMYCINLVISLFRIFEKVKVHKSAPFSHP